MNPVFKVMAILLCLLGAGLGTLFYLDNLQPVTVNFLGAPVAELQLALWLILFFCIGSLLGWAIASAQVIKYRYQLNNAHKHSDRLQNSKSQVITLDAAHAKS